MEKKEEVLHNITKILNCFNSIPEDALRHKITYNSLLDDISEEDKKKGYISLSVPAGMMKQRDMGSTYIGIYPVYYFNEKKYGVLVTYTNVEKCSTMSFGPFTDPQHFTDSLFEYEGVGIFDGIVSTLKTDASFIFSYPEAEESHKNRMRHRRSMPLYKVIDYTQFDAGSYTNLATEYVVNPFCFDTLYFKYYAFDETRGNIETHYDSANKCDESWKEIDSEKLSEFVSRATDVIYRNRDREDRIITETNKIISYYAADKE